VEPGRRERFARASRRRVIFSGSLMPQSGRADELSIRSASPQMVEGEAVPASLIGGVWDPSPKLRRVGWFLHRNAKRPRTLAETRAGTAIDSPACRPGSKESMPEASVSFPKSRREPSADSGIILYHHKAGRRRRWLRDPLRYRLRNKGGERVKAPTFETV